MHSSTLTALLLALAVTAITTTAGGLREPGGGSHERHAKKDDFDGGDDNDPNTLVKCAEDNGATERDVNEFLGSFGNPIDKHEVMCVAGCFFMRKKLLDDGGLNKEAYMKVQTPYIGEENAAEAADYCEAKMADVPREICELGAAYYACDIEVYKRYPLV